MPPPPPERPTKPPLGQAFSALLLQAEQEPQYTEGWTATFWPIFRPHDSVSAPSSLTVPENSWPMVMGMLHLLDGLER